MTQPRTIRPDNSVFYKLGDENAGQGVITLINQQIAGTGDRILHHTTFDFGMKTLALTLQGIILVDANAPEAVEKPSISSATYGEIRGIQSTRHDREIRLRFHDGRDLIYRMGNSQTVAQLRRVLQSYRNQFNSNGDPQLWGTDGEELNATTRDPSPRSDPESSGEPPGIAERVRFWEEQDRINQALIPRVIRQNELLSKHSAEHDNLPELIGRVITDAMAEQAALYNTAMERATADMKTAYEQALDQTRSELEEKYSQELEKANAKQTELYESAITTVRREASRTKRIAITVATGAAIAAAAAVIVAILI